ncbi:MAG: hypothetical protein HW386_755 [Gammaproteobacteria bacterium]|nr:hypothetical protein [Gammaproteobacteria bacterium]
MPKKKVPQPAWLTEPEKDNYPAAKSYLNLIYSPRMSERLVAGLRRAPNARFKAKDIFRASGLSLLGVSNYHIEKDQKKIKGGVALSPILLVRDRNNGKVIVADGYHRLCAVYTYDEDAWIPCKIA